MSFPIVPAMLEHVPAMLLLFLGQLVDGVLSVWILAEADKAVVWSVQSEVD